MDEYYLWLVLGRILRNKVALSKRLIDRFSNPEIIFSSSVEDMYSVEGVIPDVVREIKSFKHPPEEIRDEVKKIRDKGVRLIHLNHPDYPERLKNIVDPPLYFYMKGCIRPQDYNAIAIVGTRRPTVYGRKVAEMLATEISSTGFTIVSGMARGIDSFAHRAALKAGGRSMAVLGCGIDVVYPRENSHLLADIEGSGAVISEFPMGTGPEKKNFPQRNRVISGLSLGTVVIEAAEKSGSLITARFALEQGREVFAVPGNINSPVSTGTNNLIKEGAKLVASTKDILEEFRQLLTHELKHGIKDNSVNNVCLSGDEENIYRILAIEPKHINQIIIESGFGPQRVMQILLDLEIKGLAEQLQGSCYIKANL